MKLNLKIRICFICYIYCLTTNKTYNFYYFPCSYSLTYLLTQISFEKPFWWSSIELGHWEEGEIPGPAKWIWKWRGHGTLTSIVGRHGWPTRNFLNSRRSRMAKTVTLWPWWQPFNSFCFESLSFFPLFPFFSFCYAKKWRGHSPPRSPQYRRPWIHMCEWALLKLLALPFVSSFLCIKIVRILFHGLTLFQPNSAWLCSSHFWTVVNQLCRK